MKPTKKLALFTIAGVVGLSSLALADAVTSDDAIIQGSLCVGMDCVNGTSFDFDTIRLSENNVRIRFTDTSNSASFPSNDWQLTANDSTNGGANYFAIEDLSHGQMSLRVDANAGQDALVVAAGGKVGMGTPLPEQSLHMRSNNTPGMRLEQDGSGGFQPQVWDVAGNEATFFVRDVTAGTSPLVIEQGAPDSVMTLEASGDITISGLLNSASSRTLKHNIEAVDPDTVLEAVSLLPVHRWRYLADPTQAPHIGPMAEDFHAAFAVGNDPTHISTVDTSGIALASIQALNSRLEAQNQRLQAEKSVLEARLDKLESTMEKLLKSQDQR